MVQPYGLAKQSQKADGLQSSLRFVLISLGGCQEDIGVPLGGLEGYIQSEPEAHMFTGSKARWHQITYSLPELEAGQAMESGLDTQIHNHATHRCHNPHFVEVLASVSRH